MKRRTFVELLIASAVVRAGTRDEWLVIADTSVNLNSRRYSADLIARMAESAKGLLVTKDENIDGDRGLSFLDSIGVCEDARVVNGQLHCRFHWFVDPPIGMRVTPSGRASVLKTPFGFDQVGKDYVLQFFATNEQSAFVSATAV